MSEKVQKSYGGRYVHFDGMTWPTARDDDADKCGIEWILRYGAPTRVDILYAASIVSAYKSLIAAAERRRNPVIAALRKAAR